MKNITVEYFAILRDHAGQASENLATETATAGELFAELEKRYGFPELSSIKVAINDEFGDWDAVLHEGDRIVFIPPVAGG
jgi:molybdopterin converting factor subunit 1